MGGGERVQPPAGIQYQALRRFLDMHESLTIVKETASLIQGKKEGLAESETLSHFGGLS